MIATKDSAPIDPAAVAERVRTMFPWLAKSVGMPPQQPEGNDTFAIPMGEAAVVVVPIHVPMPKEALTRAIGMNWFWPGAQEAFDKSRAHFIISILTPTNDPRYMRSNAQRVTCVTAALAEMVPATGIYWSTADHVVAPEHFIALTEEAGEDAAPFDLWVTVEFFAGPKFEESKEIFARTNGLHVFIGREVECGPYVREPGELGLITRNVGWYVLDRRIEFKGGETIEYDEAQSGRIELGRTSLFQLDSKAVYRIVLGEAT